MKTLLLVGCFFAAIAGTAAPQVGPPPCEEQDTARIAVGRFYEEYIVADDANTRERVLREHLTLRLYDRLQVMFSKEELDYDPFLEAQDWDPSDLDRLRIERDTLRDGVFRVLVWDKYRKKYRRVELGVAESEGGYRIDRILTLPGS